MSKFFTIFVLFLCFITTLSAQEQCLSNRDLQKLYSYTEEQLDTALYSYGAWSFIYKEPSVQYVLVDDTLSLNMVTWKNIESDPAMEIYLYYRDSTFQILEFWTDKSCYQSILSAVARKSASSKVIIGTNRREFVINKNLSVLLEPAVSRNLYSVCYYNPTLFQHLVEAEPERLRREQEIFTQKITKVQNILSAVDLLEMDEHYGDALSLLDTAAKILPDYDPVALNMTDYNTSIANKKRMITKKRDDQKVTDLIDKGVEASEKGLYSLAQDYFRQALTIDNVNPRANNYLDIVERKMAIMRNRATKVYDYKLINEDRYAQFVDSLRDVLNQILRVYSYGTLRFNCHIVFDTNARNLSYSQMLKHTTRPAEMLLQNECDTFLKRLIRSSVLLPSAQEGIFVNAETDVPVSLSWHSQKVAVHHRIVKNVIRPAVGFDSTRFDFGRFIENKAFIMPGKYDFSVQRICSSDSVGHQVWFTDYHYVGPEAVAYSLLVPGLGTLLATQGTRGGTLVGLFYGFAGTAGLTAYLYKKELKILAALDNPTSDSYLKADKRAKYYRWSSIGCITIAAGTYLTSLVSAAYRGIQNKKNAKIMQNFLKEGPILVDPYDYPLP